MIIFTQENGGSMRPFFSYFDTIVVDTAQNLARYQDKIGCVAE